jgi:extradiol dioxygenase
VGIASLGYLGVETTKLDEWMSFARDILAFQVGTPDERGDVALRIDERPARFVLRVGEHDGVSFLGWEVTGDDVLEQLARSLAAAGIATRRGAPEECATRQVGSLLHATDPAGQALELFTAPRAASTPFRPPRPISGFRTGDLGLGHIVVQVEDVAATVAFYTDVFGFRLSDRLQEKLYFLRCNRRHHSIGIADIGGPPRTLHVMVEVADLDDVGVALDLSIERGIRVSTLGLHTNDRMTSFYVQTPSGFEIEYGWHGLLVDEADWTTAVIDRPSVWGHHQLDPDHPPGPRAFRRLTT